MARTYAHQRLIDARRAKLAASKQRPVYCNDIFVLADRLGDQIEALAERAGREHRVTVVSCVLACIRKRFSADLDERSALLLAVMNGDPLSAPQPEA